MSVTCRTKYLDLVLFTFYQMMRWPILPIGLCAALAYLGWRDVQILANYTDISLLVKILVLILFQIEYASSLLLVILLVVFLVNISRMNKTVLTEFVATVGPNSFTSESKYIRMEIKWTAVPKLARTRSHLYVYFSQMGVLDIPRRDFRSQEAWDQFYQACQERFQAARQKPAPAQ